MGLKEQCRSFLSVPWPPQLLSPFSLLPPYSVYNLFVVMGKKWMRSPEQMEYLKSHFSAYLEAHKSGKSVAFRSRLYEGWARRWLEREVVFPSWKEGDTPLTRDQMEELGKAISKRKMVSLPELKPQLALIRNIFQQLYNYVHWHGLAKPVCTRSPRSLLSRYIRKVSNAKGKGMATRCNGTIPFGLGSISKVPRRPLATHPPCSALPRGTPSPELRVPSSEFQVRRCTQPPSRLVRTTWAPRGPKYIRHTHVRS